MQLDGRILSSLGSDEWIPPDYLPFVSGTKNTDGAVVN